MDATGKDSSPMESDTIYEEFLDIPSDNESVDGLCDTDSESVTSEENFDSRVSRTEFDYYQETLRSSNDDIINVMPLSERLANLDASVEFGNLFRDQKFILNLLILWDQTYQMK